MNSFRDRGYISGERDRIGRHGGLRKVDKLLLSAFWSKYGERTLYIAIDNQRGRSMQPTINQSLLYLLFVIFVLHNNIMENRVLSLVPSFSIYS